MQSHQAFSLSQTSDYPSLPLICTGRSSTDNSLEQRLANLENRLVPLENLRSKNNASMEQCLVSLENRQSENNAAVEQPLASLENRRSISEKNLCLFSIGCHFTKRQFWRSNPWTIYNRATSSLTHSPLSTLTKKEPKKALRFPYGPQWVDEEDVKYVARVDPCVDLRFISREPLRTDAVHTIPDDYVLAAVPSGKFSSMQQKELSRFRTGTAYLTFSDAMECGCELMSYYMEYFFRRFVTFDDIVFQQILCKFRVEVADFTIAPFDWRQLMLFSVLFDLLDIDQVNEYLRGLRLKYNCLLLNGVPLVLDQADVRYVLRCLGTLARNQVFESRVDAVITLGHYVRKGSQVKDVRNKLYGHCIRSLLDMRAAYQDFPNMVPRQRIYSHQTSVGLEAARFYEALAMQRRQPVNANTMVLLLHAQLEPLPPLLSPYLDVVKDIMSYIRTV